MWDKALAERLGFTWMDKSAERQYDLAQVYQGSMMSADVRYEDLKGKVLLCAKTGLPFNIQARELAILQQKKLPLPRLHWRTRLEERDAKFIFSWQLKPRRTEDALNTLLSPVPEHYKIREKEIA